MDPITTPAAAPAPDEFSNVFASITADAPPSPSPDDGAPTPASPLDAAATEVKEQPPEGGTESAAPVPAVPSPTDGLPPVDSSAPQPGQPPADEDWKTKFDQLNNQFEELRKAQETPPAAPAPAAAAPPPVYDAEETAFLTKYAEEWPDIARGEELKRRGEYQQLVNHVFSEVARVYGPAIREALDMSAVVGDNEQLTAIRRGHSDYDAIYDDVVKWTDTLPGYMKSRAKEVMESGTSTEVIEMISDFKKATGRVDTGGAPAPTPAPTAPPVLQSVANLSDAAKKAAKTMGVVSSKRSAGAAAPDPNDFDGAWSEANAA